MSASLQELIKRYQATVRAQIRHGQTYFEVTTPEPNGGARVIADAIADNYEAHGVAVEVVGDNLSATITPLPSKVTDQGIIDLIEGRV